MQNLTENYISETTAIVPTYNRDNYISDTLNSLINQTLKPKQIIVVNDGSTDKTLELLKSKFTDKVYILNKSNGGKSSAINLAMKHANGKYIWICDDDDIAMPTALEIMENEMISNHELSYVIGDYRKFFETSTDYLSEPQAEKRKRSSESNLKINFLEEMFSFQFASLVKKSVYQKFGDFDESLIRSQDYEMILRISRYEIGLFIPKVLFLQRCHEGIRGNNIDNFSNNKIDEKWIKYDQIFFKRIYQDYNLNEFLPSYAQSLPADKQKFSCLSQRCCVMAKRGMWDYAIDDIENLIAFNIKPSKFDIILFEEVNTNLIAWQLLYKNKRLLQRLKSLSKQDNNHIIYYLMRPLVWQIKLYTKRGKFREAAKISYFILQLMGIRQMIFRILHLK